MLNNLEGSFVRIFSLSKMITGAGFLVADNLILTCAHVVTGALKIPNDIKEISQSIDLQEIPQKEICLDFPFTAPREYLYARVVKWLPMDSEGKGDIACLEIKGNPPKGACAGRLIDTEDIWEHRFRTFGFPENHDEGVWTRGILLSTNLRGWIQIQGIENIGYFVKHRFSHVL